MKSLVIAFLTIAFLTSLSASGAEKDAAVDAVLEKYVTAIGGKEAWGKVESQRIKADLEAMGSTSDWTLEAKAPNKRMTRVDLPGIGLFQDGFDGQAAWSKTHGGVRVKEGEELARAKREAEFRREIRLKEIYANLEAKADEKFNDEEVRVLEAKSSAAGKDRFSFSAKTGLLVRQQSEFQTNEGNQLNIETEYSDYRDVDGIKYPHAQKFKILMDGQQVFDFELKVKEIKHNEKIDDGDFKKPE